MFFDSEKEPKIIDSNKEPKIVACDFQIITEPEGELIGNLYDDGFGECYV